MSGDRWMKTEFEVVVKKYCAMWKAQQAGQEINIPQNIRDCITKLNQSRNNNSIRRRFNNISYVFKYNNLVPVRGLKESINITPKDRDFMWEIATKELEIKR
jgi:hypothetical protein